MKKTVNAPESKSTLNTINTNKKGEITMKKTSIKNRVMTAVLATAAALSICTVAMTSTAMTVTVNAASVEEFGKKVGIDAADAAFDTLGDLFPGAKIVFSPFKTLFHAGMDDKDPMEIMSEKLDQMDNKLDKLSEKLDDLNENINKNTEWMAQKVQNTADMSELRADFKGLSPQLAKFVKDVKAIETNPKLNKTQKIMRLAALTDTTRFDSITTYVYNIMKSMDGTDPAYVNMFRALYAKEAINSMFAREAYKAALPTAEALLTQYVSAVALMQECQTAVKAVSEFKKEDIEALGTGSDLNLYINFDLYRHSLDNNDASDALAAAAKGAKNFKTKYDRAAFINKNAETSGREITLDYNEGCQYVWSTNRSDHLDIEGKVKANALTTAELSRIADHVRIKYSSKTLYDYLMIDMGISGCMDSDSYIILSDKVSVSKTRNEKLDKSLNGIYNVIGYDRVGTVKAIRMGDSSKSVVDLKLFSYQTWDDDWCSWMFGTDYDIDTSTANLENVNIVRVFNA